MLRFAKYIASLFEIAKFLCACCAHHLLSNAAEKTDSTHVAYNRVLHFVQKNLNPNMS